METKQPTPKLPTNPAQLTTNADDPNEDSLLLKHLSHRDSQRTYSQSKKDGKKSKTMTENTLAELRAKFSDNDSPEKEVLGRKLSVKGKVGQSVDMSKHKKTLSFKYFKKTSNSEQELMSDPKEEKDDKEEFTIKDYENNFQENPDVPRSHTRGRVTAILTKVNRPDSRHYDRNDDIPISFEQLQMLDAKFIDSKTRKIEEKKQAVLKRKNTMEPQSTVHRVLYTPESIKLQRLRPRSTELDRRSAARRSVRPPANTHILNISFFVFSPNGKYKILWDIICMSLIIYDMLMVPFFLSFDASGGVELAKFDFAANIYFLTDILLSCNTGYYEKGDLIMDRKSILVKYFKGWFWIDFISSFPFTWLFDSPTDFQTAANLSSGNTQFYYLLKILRFVRIIRLLRILKLRRILNKFAQFFYVSVSVSILIGFTKLCLIILTIAHWIACLWHYLGSSEFNQYPLTWLEYAGIQDQTWDVKYITSVYWATTTMVTIGYGDIVPITPSEKLFAMSVMLVACGIFAFVMNKINELLLEIDSKSSSYKNKLTMIGTFLDKKRVNFELKVRIKKFCEYMLSYHSAYNMDQAKVFSMLSSNLKHELITQINLKIIMRAKVLTENFDNKPFLEQLAYKVHEKNYTIGELIFSEGDEQDDMSLYIIRSGSIEIFGLKSFTTFKILDKGYFGELAFFSGQPRIASARAKDFCRVFKIKREDFLETLKGFPLDLEKYHMIKDNITLQRSYADLRLRCYSCHQLGHTIDLCPQLHYELDRRNFILRHQVKVARHAEWFTQFRKSFVRFERPKTSPFWTYKNLETSIELLRDNLDEEYFADQHLAPEDEGDENPVFRNSDAINQFRGSDINNQFRGSGVNNQMRGSDIDNQMRGSDINNQLRSYEINNNFRSSDANIRQSEMNDQFRNSIHSRFRSSDINDQFRTGNENTNQFPNINLNNKLHFSGVNNQIHSSGQTPNHGQSPKPGQLYHMRTMNSNIPQNPYVFDTHENTHLPPFPLLNLQHHHSVRFSEDRRPTPEDRRRAPDDSKPKNFARSSSKRMAMIQPKNHRTHQQELEYLNSAFNDYCTVKSYKVYYPHNNIEQVLSEFQVNASMIYQNESDYSQVSMDDGGDEPTFESQDYESNINQFWRTKTARPKEVELQPVKSRTHKHEHHRHEDDSSGSERGYKHRSFIRNESSSSDDDEPASFDFDLDDHEPETLARHPALRSSMANAPSMTKAGNMRKLLGVPNQGSRRSSGFDKGSRRGSGMQKESKNGSGVIHLARSGVGSPEFESLFKSKRTEKSSEVESADKIEKSPEFDSLFKPRKYEKETEVGSSAKAHKYEGTSPEFEALFKQKEFEKSPGLEKSEGYGKSSGFEKSLGLEKSPELNKKPSTGLESIFKPKKYEKQFDEKSPEVERRGAERQGGNSEEKVKNVKILSTLVGTFGIGYVKNMMKKGE